MIIAYIAIGFAGLVGLIYILSKVFERPVVNVKDLDVFTEDLLRKEREQLLEDYKCFERKMNEVNPDCFDLAFDDYKIAEQRLELNRKRFMKLQEEA